MAEYEGSCEMFHPQITSGASLAKAVDLFVMTKFGKCLQACCEVIKVAKCEPEQERNLEVLEAATALGIQALAEMDQWYHTVSFITEVYGAVHLCSARIIQVCILLHAHVEEYLPCHKLVQTWLDHSDNFNTKQCAQVIRVYGQHILLPLGQFGILEEIVNKCQSLDKDEKAALLELPQSGRYKDAKNMSLQRRISVSHPFLSSGDYGNELHNSGPPDVSLRSCSNRNNLTSLDDDQKKSTSSPKDSFNLLAVCKKVYSRFLGYFKSSWRDTFIVVLMAVFAIYALVHTLTGDPVSSISRLVVLWRGFLQRLKSLTTD